RGVRQRQSVAQNECMRARIAKETLTNESAERLASLCLNVKSHLRGRDVDRRRRAKESVDGIRVLRRVPRDLPAEPTVSAEARRRSYLDASVGNDTGVSRNERLERCVGHRQDHVRRALTIQRQT